MFAVVFILILALTYTLSDIEVSLPNGKIRGTKLRTYSTKSYHAFTGNPYALPSLGNRRFQFSDPEISLPNGRIRGQELKTFFGKPFHAFTGIPYALPPTGTRRFQPPDPNVFWSGVLNATRDGNMCYQWGKNFETESEDCLYLNVYIPVTNSCTSKTKLPVLFWIYGGAYAFGSPGGPDAFKYFMDEEVVVVSPNYRVGPLGFLSTGDSVLPGNAGLKDQHLALKWTKQNIDLFGGDPEKITIFGQSAGGASVGYHILSPKSAGLFRAAIAASGAALTNFSSIGKPKEYAYQIANLTGFTGSSLNSSSILEHLQRVPANILDQLAPKTILVQESPTIVIEPKHDGAFVTGSMYEAFESGNYNRVPLMLGINSEESIIMANYSTHLAGIARDLDNHIQNLIPPSLRLRNGSNRQTVGKEIKEIYLPDGQNFTDNLGRVIRFNSDNVFSRGIIKQAKLMSKFTDVYFYQFSYVGKLTHNTYLEGAGKCGHGDDNEYLFINGLPSRYDKSDFLTHQRLLRLWTNFAKTLNPTPKEVKLFQNIEWPKMNQDQGKYLDIDKNLTIRKQPKGEFMLGWDNIWKKYAERPYIIY